MEILMEGVKLKLLDIQE